jgi:hypothetical protein
VTVHRTKLWDCSPTRTSEFIDTKRSKQPQLAVFRLKQQLGGFYLSLPFPPYHNHQNNKQTPQMRIDRLHLSIHLIHFGLNSSVLMLDCLITLSSSLCLSLCDDDIKRSIMMPYYLIFDIQASVYSFIHPCLIDKFCIFVFLVNHLSHYHRIANLLLRYQELNPNVITIIRKEY